MYNNFSIIPQNLTTEFIIFHGVVKMRVIYLIGKRKSLFVMRGLS